MQPQVTLVKRRVVSSSIVAMLAALSVALSFIQIPFPPAPFLKYDLAGVPLIIAVFLTGPRYAIIADTVLALVLLRGGDPIGAFMKWLAEVSTFIPMYYMYRYVAFRSIKLRYAASSMVGLLARTSVMVAANYLIDPFWLILAHWAITYAEAVKVTMYLLPMVALFNASIAAIYVSLSYSVYLVVFRRFRWLFNA